MKYIAWLIFFVQGAASPTVSPQQESAVQAETYAVYSAMMTSRTTQLRDSDEVYLIQEQTVIDSGAPSCVTAPPGDAAALADIQAEYSRRDRVSVTLTRQFVLPKPYELLDRDKVETFLKDAGFATPYIGSIPPRVNPNPLYPRAKRVVRFSEIYFDRSHTFAVALMGIYSTTADYIRSWRTFKKSANGVWEENRTWKACGMSGAR